MNGRRHGWKVVATALSLALMAAACGDDDDDNASSTTVASPSGPTSTAAGGTATSSGTATTTAAAEKPGCTATVPGTQINYGVFVPSANLDPVQELGSYFGGSEGMALYDALMRYDFDKKQYVPQAAESLTPNATFTEWTLKLRPGMKYSNGDPFDVDNLFAHLDRFAQPGVRNSSIVQLKQIASRVKMDGVTAKFTLVKPWASFPYVFSDIPGQVVNTKAIGTDATAFGQNPPPQAGLGPFVLERFVPNEEMVFKARSDYWGGPVCVERLRFVYVPGGQATYDAFKSGDLNAGFLRDDGVMRTALKDGVPAMTEVQDSSAIYQINVRSGAPMADQRLREAMSLAIDQQAVSQRAYGGALFSTRSFIHPDSGFYSNDVKALPPLNADRARQLVTEAKAAGFNGTIRIVTQGNPPLMEQGIAIEAMLDAVGFDAQLQLLPGNEAVTHIFQGDFDVSSWGYSFGQADAAVSLARNLRSDSAGNYSGYKNPAMDATLDEMLAASTQEAQIRSMAKINNLLVIDLPSVPLGASEIGIIHKPELKGIKQTQQLIFLFDKAYIEK